MTFLHKKKANLTSIRRVFLHCEETAPQLRKKTFVRWTEQNSPSHMTNQERKKKITTRTFHCYSSEPVYSQKSGLEKNRVETPEAEEFLSDDVWQPFITKKTLQRLTAEKETIFSTVLGPQTIKSLFQKSEKTKKAHVQSKVERCEVQFTRPTLKWDSREAGQQPLVGEILQDAWMMDTLKTSTALYELVCIN